jgi:Arc/MetJ family transcription regulator
LLDGQAARTVYTGIYTPGGDVSKILVDVDDALLQQVQQLLGSNTTKRTAVNESLSYLVRMRSQQAVVDWFRDTDPLADLRDPDVRAQGRR